MSLFSLRLKQLKEYMDFKRRDSLMSQELVRKYKERSKSNEEYENFKKSLINSIDKLFNKGKSKIIIKPKPDKVYLYEKLLEDSDFQRYYKCEVKEGNQLVLEMVEIQ